MIERRKEFASLITGSRLYGTEGPDSDLDLFKLTFPTLAELVGNRHVTVPHCIKNGLDTREVILGEFVMSLGIDVERSLTALHYGLFGELTQHWLRRDFVNSLLTVARRMHDNAKTDKARAHAYRVWQAHVNLRNGASRLYPMSERERAVFMGIKDGGKVWVDWNPTVSHNRVPDGPRNTDALAKWVWAHYQKAVG